MILSATIHIMKIRCIIFGLVMVLDAGAAQAANRGALSNVAEAASYSLVYSLDIPNTPSYPSAVLYDIDLHAYYPNFTRVAYYLELQSPGSPLSYVWVSFDAPTADVNRIGVPAAFSGAIFQQPVANMNVFSSVASIVEGVQLQGGNIEFWPNNYSAPNAVSVPNASDANNDWGDTRSTSGTYGSMQIHNSEASQVLLAFNRWGGTGGTADVGIGNRPGSPNADWTSAQNAAGYTVKTLQVFVLSTDNNPPALAGAAHADGWTNIILTFSKALDDSAADAAHYSLDGGVDVLSATLDPVSKLVVTLTTSPQQPSTAYTVTVNDLRDRTPAHLPLPANSTATFISTPAGRGTFANVPEASDYALVYSLDIPDSANYAAGVSYGLDLRAYHPSFSRVGYYLELQKPGGPLSFIWVSMDPVTSDVNQIGVPTVSSGAVFQQPVANMNVLSSVAGIVQGTNLQGGNIEFWPYNYSAPNALGVPNASASLLDWGDTMSTSGNHGSMQLHNAEAGQVLFAFSRWGGSSGVVGLGIGNQPAGHPDWTFAANAASYAVKTLQVFALPAGPAQPPELASAVGQGGWTNVVLTFSKALEDDATNTVHYELGGGLSVLGAALDPVTKLVVTLTTTPQQPGATYAVTVNGLRDRTSAHTPIAPNTTATFQSSPGPGALNNVAEANNYALVYSLTIPNNPNYSSSITYDLDRRGDFPAFSRVAYYMELQKPGGPLQYVWVSMDPFVYDVNLIGVPTAPSGAIFQQPVANMNVFSSVPGIVQGTNLQGGNMEFWGSNYSAPNAAGVPNASDSLYDWGDSITSSGNYGSMQIHNAEARQVVFAFNRWGGNGSPVDVGIGNQPSGNPDWTFSYNAANYTVKNLQVWVMPDGDPPPVLTDVASQAGWTNVVLTFNQPVDDSATNVDFYSFSGGLTVLSAAPDPVTKLSVTLTTAPQQPATLYTLTINGVRNRTARHTPLAATTITFMSAVAERGAYHNVPEAADYALVYALDIPAAANYAAGVGYGVDLRAHYPNFSRVAYYLELRKPGGPLHFMWVSMDPLTADVNQIGVPTLPSGAVFQQPVANMNVLSSASGIVNGAHLQGGNIEFWPYDYSAPNTLAVPGASDSLYDWGDTMSGTGTHGSMQIHNAEAGQVLFAFNNWGGSGGTVALGIGNQPAGNPDWTFAANAGSYDVRALEVYVLPAGGANNPPVLAGATGVIGGTNLVLTFSKALDDSAADPAHFALSGGVSVLDAVLDPINKLAVTLTTSPQQPATSYTVTVNDVRDRTASHLPIAPNSSIEFVSARGRGAILNVAEASDYALVYSIEIPTAANYAAGIAYDVDLRSYFTNFNRIAYYIELATAGGPLEYLWASLDPFTSDINQIGVPTLGSYAFFQQPVANLNVFSSAASVTPGTSLQGGNIEFWPGNYSAPNAVSVPNASETLYDWGDTATTGYHGSMQLHNAEASQVLFAFNNWGGAGGTVALGIGNQPSGNPDWTFAANAGSYAIKTLQVYVRPVETTQMPFHIVPGRYAGAGPFSFSWDAKPGFTYLVLRKESLDASPWIQVGQVTATGFTATFTDTQALSGTGFYCVRLP